MTSVLNCYKFENKPAFYSVLDWASKPWREALGGKNIYKGATQTVKCWRITRLFICILLLPVAILSAISLGIKKITWTSQKKLVEASIKREQAIVNEEAEHAEDFKKTLQFLVDFREQLLAPLEECDNLNIDDFQAKLKEFQAPLKELLQDYAHEELKMKILSLLDEVIEKLHTADIIKKLESELDALEGQTEKFKGRQKAECLLFLQFFNSIQATLRNIHCSKTANDSITEARKVKKPPLVRTDTIFLDDQLLALSPAKEDESGSNRDKTKRKLLFRNSLPTYVKVS